MNNIVAYHGIPNIFSQFETSKIGCTTGTGGAGFGIYFTNTYAEASTYGENIYTVNLKLLRGLSNDKVTLTRRQISDILRDYEKEADNSYIEAFGSFIEALNSLIEYSDTDSDIIGDIINASGCKECLFSVLKKHGYNHTKAYGGMIDGTITNNYVMFDPSDIEILTIK